MSRFSDKLGLIFKNKTFLQFVEQREVNGSVIRPETGDIDCAQFSVGDHQSGIAPSTQHVLILSTQCRGSLHAEISGQETDTDIRPGTLSFVNAGHQQCYDYKGYLNNTILVIDDDLFRRVSAIDPRVGKISSVEPRLGWTRPALQNLIEEQYRILDADEAGSRVLSESIALRIAYELLCAFSAPPKDRTPPPLTQAELNQLIDFIDAEMETNFDLTELALILDRDPFSFTRSFKAATGETPHQFVIQRRLMRVKELLLNTNDTLADISYATGFSNQPHMTSTFSKHVGTSPGKWRKAVKG